MTRWSFYRKADGLFTGRRQLTSNAAAVELDTPEGCVAIEGYYDRFRHRVDLTTGEVVSDESLGAGRAPRIQR